MATLILSVLGTVLGTVLGGPIGGAIGALAGRKVDAMIFAPGTREGPRLNELAVSTSSYGSQIGRQFGKVRVAGQIIWATDLVEHKDKHGNGKGRPKTIEYSYTASFAVALSSRPIGDVARIWADGKLLRGAGGDLKTAGTVRVHNGHGDQPIDPLLAGAEPAGQCPAYRGLAYVVFEDLQLGDFGNRIPALSFEVIADEGGLTFADLLSDVIEDVDAAVPLDGLLGVSCEGSLIDLLGALDPLYPIDCDASVESLSIRPERHQSQPIMLAEAATSTNREDFGGNAGFARKRGGESEQPVAVLRYYDIDRDYLPGAQRATGRPVPGQPRTVELPATLGAATARELVEAASRRADWGRQTLSWRITQIDPAVRPGATVALPDHPGLWRVRDWEWREHGVDLTLTRLPAIAAASAGQTDPGRAGQAEDQPAPGTVLLACELPWDGNPSTALPLLVAAASSPSPAWPGAALFVDQGDGALLPLGPSGRERATIGSAITALSSASPLLFDRHSSLTVELAGTDLALGDATMRQLAMGANRALLGEEIIQFASAVPIGVGRWALSGLWRGRGGTETAIGSHRIGEGFVLLDGSGVTLDPVAVGSTPEATITAIGLGDNAPVVAPIMLRGIGLRPLAPVHGRIEALASGATRLTWTRRARGGWAWEDGVETPLNEQAEAYEVTYVADGGVLARWQVTAPSLDLEAATLTPLRTAAPTGSMAIRQIGDRAVSDALILSFS